MSLANKIITLDCMNIGMAFDARPNMIPLLYDARNDADPFAQFATGDNPLHAECIYQAKLTLDELARIPNTYKNRTTVPGLKSPREILAAPNYLSALTTLMRGYSDANMHARTFPLQVLLGDLSGSAIGFRPTDVVTMRDCTDEVYNNTPSVKNLHAALHTIYRDMDSMGGMNINMDRLRRLAPSIPHLLRKKEGIRGILICKIIDRELPFHNPDPSHKGYPGEIAAFDQTY